MHSMTGGILAIWPSPKGESRVITRTRRRAMLYTQAITWARKGVSGTTFSDRKYDRCMLKKNRSFFGIGSGRLDILLWVDVEVKKGEESE